MDAVRDLAGGERKVEGFVGPTRIGEWLLVDVRVARLVDDSSRLWQICKVLADAGACRVEEATLVIDVLEASAEDRNYLLDARNWPWPG